MPPHLQPADHVDAAALQRGLGLLDEAPRDHGSVAMVVARPQVGERAVLDAGHLTVDDGLVGDGWGVRAEEPNPEAQVTMISQRWLDVLSGGDRSRWPLAGDQLVVDFDLSTESLRPGDRLRVGTALVEVTAKPHTGCRKFVERFGVEAQRIGATPDGLARRLRGIYVRVVADGVVVPGAAITRAEPAAGHEGA